MFPIPAHRLTHQRIAAPTPADPAAIVAHMGAMQGQDYAGAVWSVGLRGGGDETTVRQALDTRRIIRTWAMRGTLHFIAAADIKWMLALTVKRTMNADAKRYRESGLETPILARAADVMLEAMAHGPRSRADLMQTLAEHGLNTEWPRQRYYLQWASYEGLIAQSVSKGNMPDYLPIADVLARADDLPHEAALAELARRYFVSRGPATVQDYIWWTGMAAGEARAGLEAIKGELVSETVGKTVYWRAAGDSPAVSEAVYLLPGFDEYILGYKVRDDVLDPQYAEHICPGGNGMFMSTIISDGRVIGTWRRTFKKNTVLVTPEPFAPLTDVQQAGFAAAAERYAAFLGLSAVIG